MDLRPFNFDVARKNVAVVMGAGATRGASFVKPESLLKPPLDTDFFGLLRSSGLGREVSGRAVLKLLHDEFGVANVGMESFYSQVSLHDKFVQTIPNGKRGRRRKFEHGTKHFMSLIPPLFEKTIGREACTYHDRLANAARSGDTFISFNYDCVLDRSLQRIAKRRWSAADGYGFAITEGTELWQDHSGKGPIPESIRILKPHGSLNWRQEHPGTYSLIPDEYAARDATDLLIIPPLWQKTYDTDPYTRVWTEFRKVLLRSRALFLVGYALPPTDVFTQAALRMDVENLEFICIVNPDSLARERTMQVLRSAITARTHVVELSSMKELAELLPEAA